ncbi:MULTISPECIES: hypothetical protein [Paracoccus]|uniref:Uncharacterized protein n=1 Tax=Paracoccus sanguinis TaxID=1545044 RepID=A0A099GL53_9RHOB|nr:MULTISPECIES: hypothetical protein [Paracoccus]KGJ23514.1 hypothetical protein IX56_01765 [Paracoccus sanguinis]MCV2449248.1 hypothetical protein [Paracoccus sp. DMF]
MLARIKSWLAITAAALLFIIGARRSDEKAGRATERLEYLERTNDAHQRMLEAASRRPHDRDALADRLRDGKF